MTDETDDIEALAGEHVLGTASAAERAAIELRRRSDPALDRAVRAWEARLAPLAEAVPAVEPPAGLLARIEAVIEAKEAAARSTSAAGGREGPSGAEILALRRSLGRWRLATAGLTALAAALAFLVVVPGLLERPAPLRHVAVLQAAGEAQPAFLVTLDLSAGTIEAVPVAAGREVGRSYELWLVEASLGAPRSLGVIGAPEADIEARRKVALAAVAPSTLERATYAVSLEPEGGSPTGAPTGPVLFTGRLIALPAR